MLRHMAMKQPVTRTFRSPCDVARGSGRKSFRHRHGSRVGGVRAVAYSIASAINAKVESMQMHGMQVGRAVDDAPAYRVTDCILQAFRYGATTVR